MKTSVVCKSAKYLGVQIHSDLNFKSHIQLLHYKLSRSVVIMYKVKQLFPKNVLTQIYHAMFNSHLLYCITIWTSTFSTHLNSIRILQNKAVKLLAGIHWRHSNSSGYNSLSILKLDDMIKLQTAPFVHRHFNKKLPSNLQSYFINEILVTLLQLAGKHVVSIITYQGIDLRNCNTQSNIRGKNMEFNSFRNKKL